MAGSSPAEAAAQFFDACQSAVSCVSRAVLQGRAYRPAPTVQTMDFGATDAVRLGRRGLLLLRVRHDYQIVEDRDVAGRWVVRTLAYQYELQDRSERGFLSYHWHPVSRSPITIPHLHVDCQAAPPDLGKAHLPTGSISLVTVVRLALADLGVDPLRPDWRAILDRAEAALATQDDPPASG